MNIVKKILLLACCFWFSSVSACWYSKSEYTDYIYSINGIKTIAISTNSQSYLHYQISNNTVVDLPITVSMKLISDEVIDISGGGKGIVGNVTGKLQYRILPDGQWVTVSEYDTPSGKIAKDSPPAEYFGNYNIWPQNLKAGDVIMIRLYVTDGMWQSGEIGNMLADRLMSVQTPFGSKISLPNAFSYNMDGRELLAYDLGGGWMPHLAVTAVYSGKERPIR